MNERIIKLALDAGLLNYVDNETPRHYWVRGSLEMEDIEKFALSIVNEILERVQPEWSYMDSAPEFDKCRAEIKKDFGVE